MGLFLPIVVTLIWLYLLWRLIIKLPIKTTYKIILAAVLLVVANYHQIAGRFFGSFADPELPRVVLIILAWAFGVFLIAALLTLVRDIFALALKKPLPKISHYVSCTSWLQTTILILAVFLSVFGVWQAVKVPNIKTIGLQLANLPPEFNGYRIVQLSDTHATNLLPASWQAKVVARANKLNPDLILISGDLADGLAKARADDIAPLANLSAKDGVIAVPGNHEYYTDYIAIVKALRGVGLTILENQAVTIQRGDASLVIAGLTDRQAKSFALTAPDLSAALADVDPHAPVIVLQHRPDSAAKNAKKGVMLQLSGHTHGGQIIGVNLLTKLANNGYLSGVYQVKNMKLYVSNGTGLWNGLALRLGVPSEITEIILKVPD